MNAALLDHLDIDGVEVSETTVPARDDYRIPIRIYKPSISRPTKPPAYPWDPNEQPLIVILHGGGFCLGCLDIEDVNCRSYCKETRATVVNVDYRLAPEYKFPTPVKDCWDVVQWLAKNAYTNPLIRANPTNGFILGGNSAGGNMSAVISTLARDSGLSPPLTGLILQIPGIMDAKRPPPDYAAEMRSWGQNSDAPVLSTEACEVLVDANKLDLSSRLINLYSEREPVSRAGLPPVFFQVCGLDPLRDEALIFERELRTVHKTPTRLMVYPGLPHGFWGFFPQLKATAKWWRETIEGLRWLLERGWEQRDLRGGAEFTMNL
ncbi:Alpha/Beta hydrolase protein [Phyllosticta citrichinensis]|uniref:Alpha/Beta hydrolase protein n=1 Tax=Phyllosticta citrichinensis TaxID=1130410 RepID=A0ABR1XL43_9PEZI